MKRAVGTVLVTALSLTDPLNRLTAQDSARIS